jgi:hypothetical protein
MGRQGDFAHREKKKSKKDNKKIAPVTIVTTPVEVEVIRKGKKKHGEEEEE